MADSRSERILWRETSPEPFEAAPLDGDVQADLAIVGGGFTGCSAALHAAAQGLDVRLLEAQTVGQGGSGRNVGLVNAGLWTPPADIEALLGRDAGTRLNEILAAAPEQVFSLIEHHGIACNAVRNGTLHCAHAPAGMKELQTRLEQLVERGAPVRLLDADEARTRTGSNAVHGALFDPRAGTIEPLAYCRGLARAAREQGAHLHEHTSARGIRADGAGWRVTTANGTVTARALIVATNAYHQHADGVEPPAFTPVRFFQFATRPLDPALLERILPGREGCWDTATVMSAFRLDAEGRLLVGSVGSLGHPAAAIHRHWARRKLAALFPRLADQPLEHAWHGDIAMTRDHLPKIVRLAGPGSTASGFMVFGYSGRGIGPGTTFGRALAEAVASGDDSGLPVPARAHYGERRSDLREVLFEAGSLADHVAWMGRNALSGS